jgi:hypothetical protein
MSLIPLSISSPSISNMSLIPLSISSISIRISPHHMHKSLREVFNSLSSPKQLAILWIPFVSTLRMWYNLHLLLPLSIADTPGQNLMQLVTIALARKDQEKL